MVLLPSLCHPDTQHAESSRNTSNWYASWITDKRSSMMSFVYVGVLVLSKVSWLAFLSRSIVIVCVCVHKGVCVSIAVCVCASVNISVFMSGCSFCLRTHCLILCVCVCEWEGGSAVGGWGSTSLRVCVQMCLMPTVYRHWQVQQLCYALSCLFVWHAALCGWEME